MDYSSIESLVTSKFKEFVEENEIEIDPSKIDQNARLIGSSSALDSIELVTFIVEVEQMLEESIGLELQLASEKAMSRRTSPFISLATLSKYIMTLLNE